jgi:hypothetical protein
MTGLVPKKEFEGMLEAFFEEIDSVKNRLSAHFRIPSETVIVIIAAIALCFILLVLVS